MNMCKETASSKKKKNSTALDGGSNNRKKRGSSITMKTAKDASVDDAKDFESDVESVSSSNSTDMGSSDFGNSSRNSRDEKKEVYKMSAKDTFRVQLWRAAVTLVLLLTAFAVTWTTYRLLKDEEESNFEVAFEKFSRTVGDAAIEQQHNMRDAFRGISRVVTGYAATNNLTWPYVNVPLYEIYAHDARVQANTEFIALWAKVTPETRDSYTNFTTLHYEEYIKESHMIDKGNLDRLIDDHSAYKPFVSLKNPKDGKYYPDIDRPIYWANNGHFSPPPISYGLVNWNHASVPPLAPAVQACYDLQFETTLSIVMPYRSADLVFTREEHAAMHSKLLDSTPEHPHVFASHPLHKDPTDEQSEIVAMLSSALALDVALLDLLPEGVEGIHCVIKNNMNQTFTYEIIGRDALFLGPEDFHESIYDEYETTVNLTPHTHPNFTTTTGNVIYDMYIYPSAKFQAAYDSNTPEIFAIVVASTFVLVAIVFFVYDAFVQTRNENLVSKAAQSNAIVSSLFPDAIRNRLLGEKEQEQEMKDAEISKRSGGALKAFMNKGGAANSGNISKPERQKPMADLFLDTTVLFADISGFTAWSSIREPTQVFTLLESLYQAFDVIAKRRKVFKVETVGDCYVAVTGLPEPRVDHAIVMARFARDIMAKMHVLTRNLEVTLGPDTGELSLRIGMHSGPVTAGVLRGERARFQLFGDTVNTCSRLETTSRPGRIHTSKETAKLINIAGRGAWLETRKDTVEAKGKGSLGETYWVNVAGERAASVESMASVTSDVDIASEPTSKQPHGKLLPGLSDRTQRLVNWNVEMLLGLVQQIVAQRDSSLASRQSATKSKLSRRSSKATLIDFETTPLEEVKEIIHLPEYNASQKEQVNPDDIVIPGPVIAQLHLLVSEIARRYNDNPFHNFDHASHVVISVIKLMSRIVAPSDREDLESNHAALHDHTYGITSSPLTQFACAFSALIHDLDHQGVSNAQLVAEGVAIAEIYDYRSVAEQNSLDLSWELMMEPRFEAFRSYVFPTSADLTLFRQLVVNAVMSTDIVDKDLKQLRNARWDVAFNKDGTSSDDNPRDEVNRKATIVIEHIIQASDISHTMQHWNVYRKWNQNLFEELYVAYLNGRMDKDPSDFWYKGEFGFFDFYIIPLTKKLKECGVFGVSSGEYLDYATKNRQEWEAKGEQVVAEMIEQAHHKYGVKDELGNIVTVRNKAESQRRLGRVEEL